jgi:hypothetical protein
MKFCREALHKKKNHRAGMSFMKLNTVVGHNLLQGINEFLLVISVFLDRFGLNSV